MSPLLPIGAGINLGGNLLNAYGQTIGGRAAEEERRRQMAEMDAIQAQSDINAQNELLSSNPILAEQAAADSLNTPAQAAIQQVAASRPVDTSAAGAQMAASDVGAGASQRAALAAQAAAPQIADQEMNNRLGRFADQKSTLESKAGRLAKLYDMRTKVAGNAGSEYRGVGKLASSIGSAGMGASGIF
jgi:hypothetical protein